MLQLVKVNKKTLDTCLTVFNYTSICYFGDLSSQLIKP